MLHVISSLGEKGLQLSGIPGEWCHYHIIITRNYIHPTLKFLLLEGKFDHRSNIETNIYTKTAPQLQHKMKDFYQLITLQRKHLLRKNKSVAQANLWKFSQLFIIWYFFNLTTNKYFMRFSEKQTKVLFYTASTTRTIRINKPFTSL